MGSPRWGGSLGSPLGPCGHLVWGKGPSVLLRREPSSAAPPPHPASADPSWLGGAGCFVTAPHMASTGTTGAAGLVSPWGQSPH